MSVERLLNVLFVTLDQWRSDCLSAVAGSPVRTPNIDALAADAVLFSNHYSVASPCGPARASLLTGLYLHNHRSVRNGVPLDARHQTIAQRAAAMGYEPKLFGFTDTTLDPQGRVAGDPALSTSSSMAPGFEDGLHMTGDSLPWLEWLRSRGYDTPGSPRDIWRPAKPRDVVDDQPTVYDAEESESAFLTRAVTDFIADKGLTPWFAHVSYFRPHHPYIAPAPYNRLYDPLRTPPPVRAPTRAAEASIHPWNAAQLARQLAGPAPVQDGLPMTGIDDAAVARLRAAYYGSVTECDAMIGRLLQSLKAAGVFDQTLIVLTSDHGDLLGDHWLWAADTWHEQAFRVPLLIRDPRSISTAGRGTKVEAFTESVDVTPTIIGVMGGRCDGVDGCSLEPFLKASCPKQWRAAAHWELDFRDGILPGLQADLGLASGTANLATRRTSNSLFVMFADMAPLLFDLKEDPGCLHNRACDAAHSQTLGAGAAAMLRWRMASQDRGLTNVRIGSDGCQMLPEQD